ncbi:SDR family NAD(P)-dependent oxidoreductase [[Clostridium] innocuum]|nr:SDR family NAD(P)-dependent oxidoreductase [[Clostridium] innocuum]
MKKKYLVTGGAGFIGSHLSEQLLKKGNDIIIIDNFNDYYDNKIKEKNFENVQNTARKTGQDCILYRGDIRDKELIDKIFDDHSIDAIISLAANAGVRPSIENPSYYIDVNLIGLINLLEASRKHKINYFVFISSSSVYGNNKKTPFNEKDSVDRPISPYAVTKKAGELLCYTYYSLYKMNIACLRYFTVYGPRQRPDLAINKFTKLIMENKTVPMYGDGTSARDYTYVDDIVDGTIKALDYVMQKDKHIYDIFNLGGSNPISLKKLITIIGETIGKKPIIKRLPMQPGDVDITFSDYGHAKKILNYEPKTSIQEGIKKYIKWYINENVGG